MVFLMKKCKQIHFYYSQKDTSKHKTSQLRVCLCIEVSDFLLHPRTQHLLRLFITSSSKKMASRKLVSSTSKSSQAQLLRVYEIQQRNWLQELRKIKAMKLTSKHIADFQQLYLEEYGITLSEDEALERSTKLIELIRIIHKPITKEDYKKYKTN